MKNDGLELLELGTEKFHDKLKINFFKIFIQQTFNESLIFTKKTWLH